MGFKINKQETLTYKMHIFMERRSCVLVFSRKIDKDKKIELEKYETQFGTWIRKTNKEIV